MLNKKKIKIAIVGLGHWGPNLVRTFQNDSRIAEVIGIESNLERCETILKKNPKLSILNHLDDCLDDESIEAVVIATPTESHYSLGIKCLHANKHLFIEKPLSHSSESGRKLVKLAKDKKRTLLVGHIFLYHPSVRKMKELIKEGKLGDFLHLKSIRTNLGPIRSDVNAIWDLAAHDLSIFNYLFERNPLKVSCRAFSILGLQQQDIAIGTLEYGSNQTATFIVSWLDPIKTRQITAIGTEKMLVFDDLLKNESLTLHHKKVTLKHTSSISDCATLTSTPTVFFPELEVGNPHLVPVNQSEPLKEECSDFIDCILSGTSPKSDGYNGLQIVNQLEALAQSNSQNGALINL
ncbi:MAG: Gfo/Idh/MocA family oxidoreductase [Cyanobacteria bacterium]|jgi:predicted dehydrogenase|nr:Gfo/Idh/MocA family oxidoreductase [Cyanobacteria bacterium GSL.Bin21]